MSMELGAESSDISLANEQLNRPNFSAPFVFAANSALTLFSPNYAVDRHREIYAKIKRQPISEPLNREDCLAQGIYDVLNRRNIQCPSAKDLHPYWNRTLTYNPLDVFGTLLQFVDYHNTPLPRTALPPEKDVEKYINMIFQQDGFVTIDEQLDMLLEITRNNLVGAIHIAFMASRFIGRGMDRRAYPNIPVTDERMLLWGKRMAQFELFDGVCDSTGDTYYFWTQVFAALFYNLNAKNKVVYQTLFEHGTEIMCFVRRWIAMLPTTSDHFVASRLGREIGLALSEPDWYVQDVN